MKRPLTHPDLLAASFLLLLVLLFLAPGTLLGKALLPADVLFSFLPWAPFADQHGVGLPHNSLIADMVLQNYSWKELIKASFLAGQLPLWNPYIFTGMPFLAAAQYGVLYPLGLPFFLLLPVAQAYVWFTGLHLLLGGLFTYGYLRTLGTGRWGALLAAAGFALAGFLVVSFQWPQVVSAAVWLPFLLTCLEQVFRQAEGDLQGRGTTTWGQRLGMPIWTLVGAGGVALQFLAGHPEISFYLLFTLWAYSCFRLILLVRGLGFRWQMAKAAVAAILIVGVGAALAGVQLIPFAELIGQNERAGSASLQQVTERALPPAQLLAFLVPDFFGNPTHHTYYDLLRGADIPVTGSTDVAGQPRTYPFWGIRDYVEGAAYVGLLPLLLALLAILTRRDRYTAFFAGYGLFSLLLAFGTPLYALFFFSIPGFDQVHSPFRWVYPYSFCVLVLAGRGADVLLRGTIPPTPVPARARRWLGPAVILVGTAALLALVSSRAALPLSSSFSDSLLARSHALRAAFPSGEMLYSYQFRNFLLFALALLLSGTALTLAARTKKALGPGALLGVLILDLYAFGWDFISFTEPRLMDYVPPALQWLRTDTGPYRVASYGPGQVLPPNSGMLVGLQDARGYDTIIPRQYIEFWKLLEEPEGLPYSQINRLTQPASLASPLLDLMNVKYVLAGQPLEQPDLDLVYQGEVLIYQNRDVLPRAFAVFDALEVPDQEAARRVLAQPGFDPRRTVLLQGGSPPPQSSPFSEPMHPAQVLHYELNSVVVSVTMPRAGYLVLTDAYFSGWQARDQEGQELPLLRANAVFRAVPLGPGEYTVTFVYSPDSFKLGLYVSFLGAVAWVFTVAYWGWQRLPRGVVERSGVRRVAKNALTPMAAQVLIRGVDLGFAIFMLRLLGPTNYGSYAFAVVLIGYFAILTDFGLGTLLTREVARDPSQASRYVTNTFLVRLGLCGVSAPLLAIITLLYHWLFGLPGEAVTTAGLFMVSLIPSSIAGTLSALFSAHEKMEYQALANMTTALVRAALGIAALLLGWGIIGLGAATVAASAYNALVFLLLFLRAFGQPRLEVDLAFGRGLMSAAAPLMLNNFLNTVFFRSDMLLLQAMRGPQAVGLYSTAYKFVDGLLMVSSFFTLALFPALSRYADSSPRLLLWAYTRALKALLLVALPITVGTTLIADQLMLLVFGEAYASSIRALQILIWFLPFSYVNGVTQYVLIAVGKQRYLTVAFLIATLFNLATNLLVIPTYGFEGAAVTTVLSELVLLVPFLWGVHRSVGPLPLRELGLQGVAAAALMGLVLLPLRHLPIALLVLLGVFVYLATLLALRTFDEEDRALLRRLLAR